ncbi:MAG: hypothetical protein JW785_09950 [Acidimicrobiia bacterium]|nr:hypothetical protein [Acidimicrobiia bacterium]
MTGEAPFVEHALAGGLEICLPGGSPAAALTPNDWETRFFGRPIGALQVMWDEAVRLDNAEWGRAVAALVAAADAAGHRLVQCHLDVRGLGLAPALEDAGFRLVDTRVTFFTQIDRRAVPRFEPQAAGLRLAGPPDLPDLLALTRRGLTDNPGFYSRYKNRAYFTPEESARWFEGWVRNDLADPGSMVVIWEVEGRAVGFLGYTRRGERDGLPIYKGTLAAVDPGWQGRQAHLTMTTFVYDRLPADEVWIENTTQLTNTPIFRNHLVTGKRLDRIELTYFRRPLG